MMLILFEELLEKESERNKSNAFTLIPTFTLSQTQQQLDDGSWRQVSWMVFLHWEENYCINSFWYLKFDFYKEILEKHLPSRRWKKSRKGKHFYLFLRSGVKLRLNWMNSDKKRECSSESRSDHIFDKNIPNRWDTWETVQKVKKQEWKRWTGGVTEMMPEELEREREGEREISLQELKGNQEITVILIIDSICKRKRGKFDNGRRENFSSLERCVNHLKNLKEYPMGGLP